MRCIEPARRAAAPQPWRAALASLVLAGCAAGGPPTEAPPLPAAADAPPPVRVEGGPQALRLPPPVAPRDAEELQLQFARRLVAAHPDTTYLSPAPERLWAIPVIEVELNADGSVRRIDVLRRPSTGDEATALAIAAIRHAAPYGDLSRLPRPWIVIEAFLFDDDLRFKPRTLELN